MPSRLNLYSKAKGYGANRIRALSPAAWFRADTGVTGTLTASAWADQSGNGRNLEQGTAGNQPIHLSYSSGTPYAYLSGVVGNYFSTPHIAAYEFGSGSFTCSAWVKLRTVGAFQVVCGAGVTGGSDFRCFITSENKLTLFWGNDGQSYSGATQSALTTGVLYHLVWGYNATSGKRFYAIDGSYQENTETNHTLAGTNPLYVGQDHSGNYNFGGDVFSVRLYNSALTSTQIAADYAAGVNGSATAGTVASFLPSDFAETSTNGATAVSSTTGETWTLNSTGAKPAQIVKSASLLGDGTASKMATANFTLDQPFTEYIVVRQISWTAGDFLTSGTAGAAGITQRTGTPKIGLNAGSGVADNSDAALGSKVIVTAVFNGASSSLQVNAGTATTGDPGAGNPGGLSLFSDNAGANYYNGQVYERIAFPAAHDAAKRATVQRYLASRHAIAL